MNQVKFNYWNGTLVRKIDGSCRNGILNRSQLPLTLTMTVRITVTEYMSMYKIRDIEMHGLGNISNYTTYTTHTYSNTTIGDNLQTFDIVKEESQQK